MNVTATKMVNVSLTEEDVQKSRVLLYKGLVANNFEMPKFESHICTLEFLRGIKSGSVFSLRKGLDSSRLTVINKKPKDYVRSACVH